MDGAALALRIRSDSRWAGMKLLLASSYGLSRKFTDPFDAVMAKPLRRKAVLDALARAFGNVTPGFKPLLGKNLPEAPKPGAGLRLLLVEDIETNRAVATILLEKQGFSVTIAANGADALEAVAAFPFDLVLMDVHMPVMDGMAATRLIRALEAARGGRRVPILALTANAMTGMREEYLAAGMDDFVLKPIRIESLLAKIMQWTREARGSEAYNRAGHRRPCARRNLFLILNAITRYFGPQGDGADVGCLLCPPSFQYTAARLDSLSASSTCAGATSSNSVTAAGGTRVCMTPIGKPASSSVPVAGRACRTSRSRRRTTSISASTAPRTGTGTTIRPRSLQSGRLGSGVQPGPCLGVFQRCRQVL